MSGARGHTIQAIIFDCFGVLITDRLQQLCDELALHKPAAAAEARALVRAANKGAITSAEYRTRITRLLGLSEVEYRAQIVTGADRNKVLLEYIPQLRLRYKTAVLSNVGGGMLRRFSQAELDSLFDAVVESGMIGYAKPEAAAYEYAADAVGVQPEACVFVDDRELFCEAARSVGMQAVVYKTFEEFKRDLSAFLPPD